MPTATTWPAIRRTSSRGGLQQLRALQQHGAVIYDSFAAGRDGAGLLVMSNGWTGTAHFTVQDELNTIPLSAFEAVDVLGLAVDPTLGWMIRT